MKKILLIKLSALGDLLAWSPIPRLLSHYDEVLIDHLVMVHCVSITENNPYIHKQITVPILPSNNIIKDIFQFIKILFRLRKEKYDEIYVFHRSGILGLLAWLAGAKKIFGYANKLNILYSASLKYDILKNRTMQDVSILRLSGANVDNPVGLDYFYESHPSGINCPTLPDVYIACNPGGGNIHSSARNRIWPKSYYVELFDSLDIPVVLMGNGQGDAEIAEYIVSNVNKNVIINLVNLTSFNESAIILRGCAIYIGNDSSLAFLAAAVGVKSLSIYGPTPVSSALPLGKKQFYIKSDVHCSPCYDPTSGNSGRMYTCTDNVCMKSISPYEVLMQCIELLNS